MLTSSTFGFLGHDGNLERLPAQVTRLKRVSGTNEKDNTSGSESCLYSLFTVVSTVPMEKTEIYRLVESKTVVGVVAAWTVDLIDVELKTSPATSGNAYSGIGRESGSRTATWINGNRLFFITTSAWADRTSAEETRQSPVSGCLSFFHVYSEKERGRRCLRSTWKVCTFM